MGEMIFLYGAPASGKTTLGRRLAAALGVEFADLDEAIVRMAGRSIPEIFAANGEAAFRDLESRALATLGKTAGSAVVALGGGSLLREENRALAERLGVVWCLETPDAAELSRRLGSAPGSRPLGNRAQEREAHYASFTHRIAGSYQLEDSLVVVGNGLARSIATGRSVVADATVAKLHAPTIGEPLTIIPSGEEYKVLATVSGLWSAFARAGLGRKDTVVAAGGGVTGDLTGFAAATWMRGIAWINLPTTLLAMTDASTGGKTGCDLPQGKNLAGAFHSAKLVVIDTDFLKTLPPSVLAAGRAEMIKHEIIGGLPHTEDPRGIPSAATIYRNLGVKVDIVRKDPFERLGWRSLLNCGHTVAHAIEKLSDYRISHGEAVATGCVEEARLAVSLGLASADWPAELSSRFAAAGLPVGLPAGCTRAALVPVMRGDKKREGGVVVFALPCGWGEVRNVPVEMERLAW